MATIKSYTDPSQSKTLSKILPLESADCFWGYDDLQKYHRINWFEDGYDKDSQLRLNNNNVCAWSLAALLGILPQGYSLGNKKNNGKYYICMTCVKHDVIEYDEPVDACYEMIMKLHELKML